MPAIAMSALPEVSAGMIASNSISLMTSFMPSLSAIRPATVGSIPTILSPSTDSYGGNVALVAITSSSASAATFF